MARGQSDYYQATRGGGHGDYRLIVLAPMDVAESVELVQLAFHLADQWRNPVLVIGDYFIAHTHQAVDVQPIDFGPAAAKHWALDGSTGGSGRAKLVSPLGDHKQRDNVGYDLADHYLACAEHTRQMTDGVTPMAEVAFADDAEIVVVAFGTPGRYVRFAVNQLRDEGYPVGYVRPITLYPFPSAEVASAAHGARVVAVYENNQGQMIDDVRLAVLGDAPVEFIGGLTIDSSGFGIGPDIDVAVIRGRIEALLERHGVRPTRDREPA
jgi:2-oxoglutarate ferredoxin oxidoreductase subunit alpha